MIPILVVSNTPYAGRTFIAAGLALKLKEMDYSVGYLKPLGAATAATGGGAHDADALFMKEVLGLSEPLDIISPFVLDDAARARMLAGELKDAQKRVTAAFKELRKKDFVVLFGANDLFEGAPLGLDALSLAAELKARTLFVEPWRGDLSADAVVGCARLFGDRFCGAVLNKVPEEARAHAKQELRPFLQRRGAPLHGVFPADRFLESITVRQLTGILNGTVLCCEDRLDEHVERFLVGAMDVESALTFFRKTPNKAVITGAHRSDIQLAALETSTKCLIITGGLRTNDAVLGKARTAGTPVISVADDTFSAISKIETRMGRTTIRDRKKVERAKQLLDAEFDMFGFLKTLGAV